MIKILHTSDIHIPSNIVRYEEYSYVFEKLYDIIKKESPDLHVITGDIMNDKLNITNESVIFASEFLKKLADLTPLRIIRGNHDFNAKNFQKLDSIKPIVTLLNHPNIIYYETTGFYEEPIDSEIIWAVHAHGKKDNNPWILTPIQKDESKIYISLFHDPILGAKLNDYISVSTKHKNINEFKDSDIVMLGDLHSPQTFRNGTIAYASSLIQQNFGEKILSDNSNDISSYHGGIFWNIQDKNNIKPIFFNIDNPYNRIIFKVNENFDYDNINFKHSKLTDKSSVRIDWNDTSSNITFENEHKLRSYFKSKYNINGIKIIKNPIYVDINNVKSVNESINISDIDTQRNIFIEFLELNGHKKDFIDEVLKIDDIINKELNINNDQGISWNIDKIWFSNFKSYGDHTEIDFKNMGNNILIDIAGENQGGKTTILDGITYVLFGKTSSTLKREKNGDNRYINNKRDLDTVEGGATININNEIYTLIRKTERKWNRDKTEVSSCSTILDFYKGTILTEEFRLVGDDKNKTQEFIETSVGDFTDFMRLVLTNADNLNDLLSQDRAVFIDSIIKDAGYYIFENKLTFFKDYRKMISKDDIKIDVKASKETLLDNEESQDYNNNQLKLINDTLKTIGEDILNQQKEKEKLLLSMDKIDDKIATLDLNEVNLKIETEKDKIKIRKEQLNKIDELKLELLTYDDKEIKNKRINYDKIKDIISEHNNKVSTFINNITTIKSKVNTINMDIKNIISEHIRSIEDESKNNDLKLSKVKDEFNTKVIEYSSVLKQDLNKIIAQKDSYKKDIDNLMEEGKKLKTLNEELETSKVCITCERPLDNVDPEIINRKVEANKKQMADIVSKVKDLKPKYEELSKSIDVYSNKLDKLSKKEYDFDEDLNSAYQKYIDYKKEVSEKNTEIERRVNLINDGNIPSELQLKLKSSNDEKSLQNDKITKIEEDKKELEKIILNKKEELETLKTEIEELEKEETKIQKKKDAINLEEKIKADIERCETLIKQYEQDITQYNKELSKIESNKKIKENIELINIQIIENEDVVKISNTEKTKVEKTVAVLESEEERIMREILAYQKQKNRDEILDVYMKCVHRDGLPSYLLKKSINIINQELSNLLSDVDFKFFFDEELNLRLSHDIRTDASQNAIESSGMERTFGSLALKLALRIINNKSRPNFIILDEITGKLTKNSVEIFNILLEKIKTMIDKLIIIEHTHPINYDVLIEVVKDNDGISSLKINE